MKLIYECEAHLCDPLQTMMLPIDLEITQIGQRNVRSSVNWSQYMRTYLQSLGYEDSAEIESTSGAVTSRSFEDQTKPYYNT